MYSDAFCKIYNEFGWNYFPEAFGEQLLAWLREHQITVRTSLDLACGTGVLCEILHRNGIQASGMDFSEGMIEIARSSNPSIEYEVADMISYRPNKQFDLVTCTGDALNHILDLNDVEQIFKNVFGYLVTGGWFIFDLLNEKEIPSQEPFDLDFNDEVHSQFAVTQDADGVITLKTTVFENGRLQFEERIREIVHDREAVCSLLEKTGFQIQKYSHQLLEGSEGEAATWYIIARKPLP